MFVLTLLDSTMAKVNIFFLKTPPPPLPDFFMKYFAGIKKLHYSGFENKRNIPLYRNRLSENPIGR